MTENIESEIFFTFFGLEAIQKKKLEHLRVATVGNPAMHIPTMLGGLPGMEALATKMMKKEMEKLSEEYKDKVNFYYADIDEKALNTATSIAGVRGVPTVVVYKKGVEVARKVGGVPENHMRDFLKSNI